MDTCCSPPLYHGQAGTFLAANETRLKYASNALLEALSVGCAAHTRQGAGLGQTKVYALEPTHQTHRGVSKSCHKQILVSQSYSSRENISAGKINEDKEEIWLRPPYIKFSPQMATQCCELHRRTLVPVGGLCFQPQLEKQTSWYKHLQSCC